MGEQVLNQLWSDKKLFLTVLPDNTNTAGLAMQATIKRMRDTASDMPEMSLEEINAEISAARRDRKIL